MYPQGVYPQRGERERDRERERERVREREKHTHTHQAHIPTQAAQIHIYMREYNMSTIIDFQRQVTDHQGVGIRRLYVSQVNLVSVSGVNQRILRRLGGVLVM